RFAASRGEKNRALIGRVTGSIALDLAADGAPEWHRLPKVYVAQPGIFHQRPDLGLRHAMFDAGAEAVERVGAHGIITAPTVGAERPIGRIAAKPLDDLRAARQRPIDASGEKFGDCRFQPERSPRKKPAQEVARSPQQT